MRNTSSLEFNINVQREIIAEQLANLYGLNIEKVYENYWNHEETKVPEIHYFAVNDTELQNFIPENCGFKSNIDELDSWTDEEATRHLIRNIFCFR